MKLWKVEITDDDQNNLNEIQLKKFSKYMINGAKVRIYAISR